MAAKDFCRLLISAYDCLQLIILVTKYDIIQICSEITHGRGLSGELCGEILQVGRFYKLICLHLPADCFMKISPHLRLPRK